MGTTGDILDVISSWPEPERRARAYAAIAEIEDEALANMKLMPGAASLCAFLDGANVPRCVWCCVMLGVRGGAGDSKGKGHWWSQVRCRAYPFGEQRTWASVCCMPLVGVASNCNRRQSSSETREVHRTKGHAQPAGCLKRL